MSLLFKNIDVLILCGGLGKRLRSVASGLPKPMVEIKGRPFLDILIGYLRRLGFRRIILGVGYKASLIKDYYSAKKIRDLKIEFCEEKRPLDTGGALKYSRKLIHSNPFMVLNGDSLTKFKASNFLRFHKEKKALVSILLNKVCDAREYGEVKIDRDKRIIKFREKNKKAKNCLINAGVYIFDKRVFKVMPSRSKFSLEKDLFPALISRGIFGYRNSGAFIDIGTPRRYHQAKNTF